MNLRKMTGKDYYEYQILQCENNNYGRTGIRD